ncbi:MAG: ribbon-helix-helix protein, CopG family [Pseudonocardiaceae bacterium]
MKRLQIYLEPEADEALAAQAAREHVSKAEIIRRLVNAHIGVPGQRDPIDDLVGRFADEPGNVDEVVYGR